MTIKELQKSSEEYLDKEIKISGWIRNHRPQKEFGFIDFSDGTSFKHLQVVYTNELEDFSNLVNYIMVQVLRLSGILLNLKAMDKIMN